MKPVGVYLRRTAVGLAVGGIVLALLLGAAALLAGTPVGFRWLAQGLTGVSGGRLEITGVQGHLFEPLDIGRLAIRTDSTRIEVERLRLEWQPRSLLHGELAVDLLAAHRVSIATLKPDTTPRTAPASLRLPFNVSVRQFDVAEIQMIERGATRLLQDARLRISDSGRSYRVQLVSLGTPWATADGELHIGKDAPFALTGTLAAQRAGAVPVAAHARLQGVLDTINVVVDVRAEGMAVAATGVVTPFRKIQLSRLTLAGSGIDPSRLLKDAPQARLAFSGVFEGQPGQRLLGTFSVANSRPGRLDQKRLPLVGLAGAVVGDARQADFSAIDIDLGAAGRFSGGGQWRAGRYALNLRSPRLDLARLHGSLYPTALGAAFQLTGDAAHQQLAGQVADASGQGRFRLVQAGGRVTLNELDVKSRGASLAAKGQMHFDDARAFQLQFSLADLDPARFGRFPRARLMARGAVGGNLLPTLALAARFDLPDGTLEGRPLRGKGRLRYTPGRLQDADIDLNLAGNLLLLKGGFGDVNDKLAWSIDAPDLARLGLGFSGRLASRGTFSGALARPQLNFTADARALRIPGVAEADTLTATMAIQATANGPMRGDILGTNLVLAGQTFRTAKLSLLGRRDAHVLSIDAQLPQGRAEVSVQGGLASNGQWRGQLRRLRTEGAWPVALRASAQLQLSRAAQSVQNAQLDALGGRIDLVSLERSGSKLASRGTLDNLPIAPFLALLDKPLPVNTDLRVAGSWDLRLDAGLDGQARLRRTSGDVSTRDPVQKLGLRALNLQLQASAGKVTALFDADTAEAGKMSATAQAQLARAGWRLSLPRTAPIVFSAKADVPDLRLLRAFIPVTVKADARLRFDLRGGGTLAQPTFDGSAQARAIRFRMPEEGILVRDGTLDLQLSDDKLRVTEGVLYGQEGRIRVQGTASLRNPAAGVQLAFERFAALTRSDRRVTLSGSSQLVYQDRRLLLEGKLTADKARIEMPAASRPQLSSDVVVVGRAPRPVALSKRFPLRLDLSLDLGQNARFRGAGLDARLIGKIRLQSLDNVLRAAGSIRVAEGTYAAYGQKLQLERGALNFIGPLNNPGIDVLAVRKLPTVTAGVTVRGTVQRPLVRLYSDPAMPDTETLSWLVLGHGLDNSGGQEFALLQVAAGALLGNSESGSLQTRLANALNIDEFEVRGGGGENLSSTVVSLGKRLSDRATLSYEQSLDGLSQVVKVLYRLTPQVRLEAQTGRQTSLDIFYSLEFD